MGNRILELASFFRRTGGGYHASLVRILAYARLWFKKAGIWYSRWIDKGLEDFYTMIKNHKK